MLDFVVYNELFLEKSWIWLNDSEIKKLTNTQDFSKDEQMSWYKSINEKLNYMIFGINFDSKPIGVCGLKNITNVDCEYWGYIGEKEYWGIGLGSKMLDRMIIESKKFNHQSIWLQVLKNNNRAFNLYKSYGFYIEIESIEMYKMRYNYD